LAEKLRIGAGSVVIVDNANGKLTITGNPANDEPTR
jgi:serine acetyltransferase